MAVHGDDFVSEGAKEDLKWFDEALAKEFKIKTEILGPDEGEVKELRILNRVVRWEEDGLEREADQRHAELIISQLDLSNAKPVVLQESRMRASPRGPRNRKTRSSTSSKGRCTRARERSSSRRSSISSRSLRLLRRWSSKDADEQVRARGCRSSDAPDECQCLRVWP